MANRAVVLIKSFKVGDLVVDPFGGSCVTGEVAEWLKRKWICVELNAEFIRGAKGRFVNVKTEKSAQAPLFDVERKSQDYYRVPRPGILWNGFHGVTLSEDGGKKRKLAKKTELTA